MSHTYIGTVAGLSFYEHGELGDESPMLLKLHGDFLVTDLYELPTIQEAQDITTDSAFDMWGE